MCVCLCVSQLGYLLAIPRSPEMKEEGDFAIDGLEFVVIISSFLICLCSCLQLPPVIKETLT